MVFMYYKNQTKIIVDKDERNLIALWIINAKDLQIGGIILLK